MCNVWENRARSDKAVFNTIQSVRVRAAPAHAAEDGTALMLMLRLVRNPPVTHPACEELQDKRKNLETYSGSWRFYLHVISLTHMAFTLFLASSATKRSGHLVQTRASLRHVPASSRVSPGPGTCQGVLVNRDLPSALLNWDFPKKRVRKLIYLQAGTRILNI